MYHKESPLSELLIEFYIQPRRQTYVMSRLVYSIESVMMGGSARYYGCGQFVVNTPPSSQVYSGGQ